MTESKNAFSTLNLLRGWILDIYPSAPGEMTVWIISEKGERVKFIDEFQPKIYVSANAIDLSRLAERLRNSRSVTKWTYIEKNADFMNNKKSKVLEITITDCRKRLQFARKVLRLGGYQTYRLFNVDVPDVQAYLYEKDIFPLAFVGVTVQGKKLSYWLLDSVESVDYQIPPLRQLSLKIQIVKKKAIPTFNDAIESINTESNGKEVTINEGDERQKILNLVKLVQKEDPDVVFTEEGDSFVFPYLARRAFVNGVLNRLILGREPLPLKGKPQRGTSYSSYGRVYFKAPMRRLYGRIHVDIQNTFIHSACDLQGLIEVSRTCRVPLHRAARASIGTIMSSLQLYQAIKNDILVPWKKSEPESYKSGWELLVADRGGFIFEPRLGIHEDVVEVDFSSMFPNLMAARNISPETIRCKCCTDSSLRVPELDYNVCRKREGIVPKTLWLILRKREAYKKLRDEAKDSEFEQIYEQRQTALKWILVTCFGYLGYRNSRFGKVDAHIAVCAFARDALLRTVRIAEKSGFEIVHGIVDSLWLKKEGAQPKDYAELVGAVSREIGVPLSVEGCYRWIVFLPSKTHAGVPVLNRYFGVYGSGKIKIRGIEARKSDTPRFIHDAQMDMIKALARAHNSKEFMEKIPQALDVLQDYAKRLVEGKVPTEDLMIEKRLSFGPSNYAHDVLQAIAARQLVKEGVAISAGQSVQYIIIDSENKHPFRRVKAAQLLNKKVHYDTEKYLELLLASAANIFGQFCCTGNDFYDTIVHGQKQKPLLNN